MADKISNYQCPACTGPLHYGSGSGKLECDYCGSSFSIDEIEALYAQQSAAAAQTDTNEESEQEQEPEDFVEESGEDNWQLNDEQWTDESGMKAYNCPSCGAELMCEETAAATSCPYCDNPTIVPASISGALKPEGILPFKLDKEAAKDAFRKHLKGRKLLPKLLKERYKIELEAASGYLKAAEKASSDLAELFKSNAEDEKRHAKTALYLLGSAVK